jgi:hypothetical protein
MTTPANTPLRASGARETTIRTVALHLAASFRVWAFGQEPERFSVELEEVQRDANAQELELWDVVADLALSRWEATEAAELRRKPS